MEQPPGDEGGHPVALEQALLNFAKELAGHRALDELFRSLSAHLKGHAQFDHAALILYDPASNKMRLRVLEPPDALAPPVTEMPLGWGPAAETWRTQQTRVDRLTGDEPTHWLLEFLRSSGVRVACWIPVTTARARLGVLTFGSREVDDYSPETVALMENLAAQVALAVEHTLQVEELARLNESIAEERDRANLLLRISNAIVSKLDLTELLAAISTVMREAIPHHFASVTLWDEAAGQLRRHAMSFEGKGLLRDGALVRGGLTSPPRVAFDSGRTLVLRRADIEALGGEPAAVMKAEGLNSVCCIPLQTARGKHGTFNVSSPEDDGFPPERVTLLERIAQEMAIAIENAIHFARADQYRRDASAQRDRTKLLLDVNNALVTQLDSHSLRLSVMETVQRAIRHDYASLAIFDPETRELRIEAMTYYDERGILEPGTLLPPDQSPAGIAARERAPRVFSRAELNTLSSEAVPTLLRAGIQSICCVPLVTQRGVPGTLNVGRRTPEGFSPADVELLREIADQVAIAVENTLAFQQIVELKNRLAEEKLYLEGEISERQDFKSIIGQSAALTSVLQQIRTVAPTDATVLLLGETGTGKELLARAIHDLSRRREQTFVRLNGAALPTGLIESELFGYERGAFTGATNTKVGRLELAHRGTLFFDEVGDLPLEVQPKLLRALQEREFERLGGTHTHRVDVRLIAATNRDLEEMVGNGSFRSDLYYRLNVFPLLVPALRDRREDIPSLVRHFVERFARELGRTITTIPTSAMAALQQWRWPGNIRELENVIERAVILSSGTVLHIPRAALQSRTVTATASTTAKEPRASFQDGERDLIVQALREAQGVIGGASGAAARLGLKRTTLHSKMRKLGITKPSY